MADALSGASTRRRCRFGPIEVVYDGRVLEPRPWTLAQSQWAAELAAEAGSGPLLELCAGAGQIGLAAAVLAGRDLVQVEVDPAAAAVAEANARRAGWGGRVEVRVGAIDRVLAATERFPLVIADPPYLRTDDTSRFPEDPRLAIDGGADGLAVVRQCLAAARHLPAGGPLVLQVAGPRQAEEVAALAGTYGLAAAATRVVDDERAVLLLRRTGA